MWNHDREIFFCDLCGESISDTAIQRSIEQPLLVLAYHECSRSRGAEQIWSVKRARRALQAKLNYHRLLVEFLLRALEPSRVSTRDAGKIRDNLNFACEQWAETVRAQLEALVQGLSSRSLEADQFNASLLEIGGGLAYVKSLQRALADVLRDPIELIHRVLLLLRESVLLAGDSKGDGLEDTLRLSLYRIFFNPLSYSFEFHWVEPYPAVFELASEWAKEKSEATGQERFDEASISFSGLLVLLERVALSEARKKFPSFYL
ncbi:MAG: hypothetical protein CMF59_13545 [Leptospiraceae bacterium]|nr:hypothetical protein [Leptospiraceae bacterium]